MSGKLQFYIFFWDGERQIYPPMTAADVRDVFAQKRAEMIRAERSPKRRSMIHVSLNGVPMKAVDGPAF